MNLIEQEGDGIMAAKKVGTLIREARTAKKLSQEQLAAQVDGLSGSDIGKAERGEKDLSQAQLKTIAKVLGVTQKSLLEAPKGGSPGRRSVPHAERDPCCSSTSPPPACTSATWTRCCASAKASSTSAAKKTTASKTGSAAKTTAAKTTGASKSLTAAEQKFLELYRAADADDKKLAAKILKGEKLELGDMLPMLLNPDSSGDDGLLGALIGKLQNMKK